MRQLILLSCAASLLLGLAYGQYAPRKDYVWARDVSVAANPAITLDGQLLEPVWAKAESLRIAYGVNDGNPGSGWKIMNVASGTPSDPADVTVKFLSDKNANRLYIAFIAKDSSVGGGGWENSDGILCGIYDRRTRLGINQTTQHRDIFISWTDSIGPGNLPNVKGGDLPSKGIVSASASVMGTSNADTSVTGQRVADQGWIIELAVALDSLGYHADSAKIDEVQMNICVWDMDWRASADRVPNRAWWGNEWGNNGGGMAGRILLRNDVNVNTTTLPSYSPDWTIPNGANFPDIVVNGTLDDAVWSLVPSIDLQYGNTALQAAYPTIGKDRSGWYTPTSSIPVVNAGLTKWRMVFKGDKLYLGVDVSDRTINSYAGDNTFDGVQLNISIPLDSLRDATAHYLPNRRFGISVGLPSAITLWDAGDWTSNNALTYGVALKPGSTVDDNNDVDAGYTVEMCLDLTKFGYPAGQQNKTVAIGLDYHDYDITPTVTNGNRVWWFREWPGSASPAFCVLDNSRLLTGVDGKESDGIPMAFRLYRAYPNPFNPSTSIHFDLPEAGTATLLVYDALGRLVERTTYGDLAAGSHRREFSGTSLSSGMYFARLEFISSRDAIRRISSAERLLVVK